MDLIKIYECLCDPTRLRLLNILGQGPLCVCHFQEILGEPQVKISKHLSYLRVRGLVQAERQGNWMIYELPAKRSPELSSISRFQKPGITSICRIRYQGMSRRIGQLR